MTQENINDQICCPPFEPELWDDKVFEWDNRKFIKDKVCTIFFMPLNFGSVMRRLDQKVRDAEASIPDYLCLSEHTSKWNMNLYLAVDKEIPGASNIILRGKYYSKVYEGSFSESGKWSKDFESIFVSKGMKIKKMYMWYTTCPKCVKKYGKNYVVFIGEVE